MLSIPRDLLLVEDNAIDANVIQRLLKRARPTPRVTHVATLAEAVDSVQAQTTDVVLLDLRLPDASGLECIAALRAAQHDVPIVVLTGMDDDDLAISCLQAGAQDYISKDEVRLEMLSRAIRYATARVEEARANRRADALQRRLAAIVETSGEAIISTTPNGTVTTWNAGAEAIFGYPADEAVGKHLSWLVPSDDESGRREQAERLRRAARGESTSDPEATRVRRDGARIVVSEAVFKINGSADAGLGVVIRDETERVEHAAKLAHKNAELRALARRLQTVREAERTRISREIHDVLGQLLTAVMMNLRIITTRLGSRDPVVTHRLEEANHLVTQTIETVQRLGLELRPTALDSLGLAAAIRDEARRFSARTDIETSVVVPGVSRPDAKLATELFRIFQELLTNVARHAKATRVEVELREEGEQWVLRVRDDGEGIDPQIAAGRESLGLLGMQERAESVGGTLTLQGDSGRGTVAIVSVPKR